MLRPDCRLDIRHSAGIHFALAAALAAVAAFGEPPGEDRVVSPPTVAAAGDRTPAQRAFQRIVALEGVWQATSTAGWTGTIEYRVLARGSAVLQLSEIAPHAGDTMATLYHLDGERLMLTHYCSAGNQPRLVATDIADDGSRAEFTFLDGTNLSSRDRGHMDRAVFEWPDGDRYTSRWTWYQDGEERWMERIEYARMP